MSVDVDNKIGSIIIDQEVPTSESNRTGRDSDYVQAMNILRGFRTDAKYDWMANYQVPEFASHYLTRQAIDSQFLNSRDYADIYLEETGERFMKAAEAQKELINRTLNQRHLQFPIKYLRIRAITDLNGNAVARFWWERKSVVVETGETTITDAQDNEFAGEEAPVTETRNLTDRFNMDILDPNDVFWDDSYAYSLQDKRFVTVRFERSLSEIKKNAKFMGYDPEKIAELESIDPQRPDDAGETYGEDTQEFVDEPDKPFTVYERHGVFPSIIKSFDESGYPLEIEPGYDGNGNELDASVNIETTVTVVNAAGKYVMLKYQPQKYRTDDGEPYRPFIRAMAYVDPRRDGGFSDSRFIGETQEYISDFMNVTMDRALMATIPTMKMKRYATDDNDEMVIGPGRQMLLNDVNDAQELIVKDVSPGAIGVMQMLQSGGEKVSGIFPETQGSTGSASTTATAVIGANIRTNARMSLREKMIEFTFLADMYWMIGQITAQFALPETAVKLMGDKFKDFDPDADFYMKPVSASLEPEQMKTNKINNLNTLAGLVQNTGHPDAPKVMNTIINSISELMGDDMRTKLGNFDEKQEFNSTGINPEQQDVSGATNQSGVPETGAESAMRS